MKKILVIFTLAFLAINVYADVDTTLINNDTMATRDMIVDSLRTLFTQVNSDIDEVSGLFNKGTGNWYYVDSGLANAAAVDGTSWAHAEATLDRAIGNCTANNGDVIFVAQGHAETLSAADAVDADVAGITIVHLGNGTNQGTYTYSAIAAEFVIGAANVTIIGGRYVAATNTITMGFSVEAAGDNFTLIGAEFPEPATATDEFVDAIDVAALAHDLKVINCKYRHCSTTGPAHFIEAGNGLNHRITVKGCDIQGEFSVAAIWSDTIDEDCTIINNIIVQRTSGQHAIEFTAAATGVIAGNWCYANASTTSIDPGSMFCIENYVCEAINESAQLYPNISAN